MIYLRAAKKIYSKHKQNAGEEESYTHLLPQSWTLLLESTNGVHFNQGLQETTLKARLFSANGIDFTSQLRDITPLWSVTNSEWTATGWEVNLRKEDLPGVSIYASIVCKINFADVLRHFPFLPPVLVNIYQDKEIKGELSVYNPYSILTIIPDSFSVASVLAKDELFKVSVRGEKGDPGKSVTASEVVATLNTQQFRGTIKDALKADAAFVTATKGDKGERGLQGVQGIQGVKGDPGKSVTASEVVATLNTQQFRGTIKEALKADAAFVTATKGDKPVVSYAGGVLRVDGVGLHDFNQQFAGKADVEDLNNYATTNALSKVETRAIRPSNADSVGSSTNNPFAPILDPNGESKVISLDIVEGTDLYLPPARLCAVGTKIYLRGSTMSCPITPYHHSTTIRPIRIYSNERDVYSAGRYYSNSNLIETFTNAEWRVDLECIVAGCGLKGWLWVNSVESKNLSEFTSSITTAIQSIAEAKQEINRLKNNTLQKGGGLQLGFYNLVNHNSGTYHVQATDYHILARRTGNGDNYPYIRVSENLPNGHEFIVDIPFNDCRVRFVLPNGGSTWGNGGTEWQSGYRYHVTKSHTKEWGVIKTAYAQ